MTDVEDTAINDMMRAHPLMTGDEDTTINDVMRTSINNR